jgi:SAM-dependent methyltransferase
MRQREVKPGGVDKGNEWDWYEHCENHRDYIGPSDVWDLRAGGMFSLLFQRGLRSDHIVLDIGCGSLRMGRLLIPYLEVGHYFGVEPNKWLVEAAREKELGGCLWRIKRPRFWYRDDFRLDEFDGMPVVDCAFANSIFTHADIRQIRRCLGAVKKVLHPEGEFLFDFKEGHNVSGVKGWTYPEVVQYPLKWMLAEVREAGMKAQVIGTPQGLWRTWVACTL